MAGFIALVVVVLFALVIGTCSTQHCSRLVTFHNLTPDVRNAQLICRTADGRTCTETVQWRKDGVPVDAEALGIRYSDGGASVIIDTARAVHEGNWSCHSNGQSSDVLVFQVPPFIHPDDAIQRERYNLGDDFVLDCNIEIGTVTENVAGFEVTWISFRPEHQFQLQQLVDFDSHEGIQSIADNVTYHLSNFSITIHNFSARYPSDGGIVYKCRVANKQMPTWAVTAITRVSFDADLEVTMGLERLTFLNQESREVHTVKFRGCPRPEITWRIGTRIITDSSPRYSMLIQYNESMTTVFLSINPVEAVDAGIMTVEARSRACSFAVTTSTLLVLQSAPHNVAISPSACETQTRATQHHLTFSLPLPLPPLDVGLVEIELMFTETRTLTNQAARVATVNKSFVVTTDVSNRSNVRILISDDMLPLNETERYVVQMRMLINGTYLEDDWSPVCDGANFFSRRCNRLEVTLNVVAKSGTECNEEDTTTVTRNAKQVESSLNEFYRNKSLATANIRPRHWPCITLTEPTVKCSSAEKGIFSAFASAHATITDELITEFETRVSNGSIGINSTTFDFQPQESTGIDIKITVIACLAALILVIIVIAVAGCVISHKCRQKDGGEGRGDGMGDIEIQRISRIPEIDIRPQAIPAPGPDFPERPNHHHHQPYPPPPIHNSAVVWNGNGARQNGHHINSAAATNVERHTAQESGRVCVYADPSTTSTTSSGYVAVPESQPAARPSTGACSIVSIVNQTHTVSTPLTISSQNDRLSDKSGSDNSTVHQNGQRMNSKKKTDMDNSNTGIPKRTRHFSDDETRKKGTSENFTRVPCNTGPVYTHHGTMVCNSDSRSPIPHSNSAPTGVTLPSTSKYLPVIEHQTSREGRRQNEKDTGKGLTPTRDITGTSRQVVVAAAVATRTNESLSKRSNLTPLPLVGVSRATNSTTQRRSTKQTLKPKATTVHLDQSPPNFHLDPSLVSMPTHHHHHTPPKVELPEDATKGTPYRENMWTLMNTSTNL